MEQLKIQDIVEFTKGKLSKEFELDVLIDNVTMDSRAVNGKSLFVAVKGDIHDAHDYVRNVVASGNYALVNSNFSEDLPNLIYVSDTTLALGLLASNYRQMFDIPVVAITGSNGKTSVKEMLRSVCNIQFGEEFVLATSGNLNNHWGMPRTLLEINKKHKVAIIEMGMNHSGELKYLSSLAKPTLAVVNNVMFAHAGHFSGLADIASAKAEIYSGLLNDGIACVDVSNQFADGWLKNETNGKQLFLYGNESTNCYIKTLSTSEAIYVTPIGEIAIQLNVLGSHNYKNALTVIAVAINLGCSIESIKLGLESYSAYKGRLEPKRSFNGALIIDDTYNANPDSVIAALEAIQVLAKPYWFIFADLKELGSDEVKYHQEIGESLNKFGVDKLLTVGNLAKCTNDIFSGDKLHFINNDDVVKYCRDNLPKDATLLIKGSNSMRLSNIVEQLIN
ncbi:MAG: UDP-N-acetylmuramoyl-tripeptide--D-alanyl-D-alanine ligase [Burkholderiales bacterium]|nr:UDP-N-acetylmuramoyl-tripeptide--D-alanyl-D-alanine ligase [Burkholderiales bacterium]